MSFSVFERKKEGVFLFPIEVTESGFPVDSIDDAIEKQNAITEKLYGKLMDKE